MRIRRRTLLLLVSLPLVLVARAYILWGTVGLPALPSSPVFTPATAVQPFGFPAWLRVTHYTNGLVFVVLLFRHGTVAAAGADVLADRA